ncbi:MAG: hypothetical protein GXO09_05715 [Crenarchaeota archaeon]|nr:hypothetical protein [Thermoproteota archaeon]
MAEQPGGEAREEKPKKIDVRAALSLIPPATRGTGKRRSERRIRLRFRDELKKGIVKLNPALASEIGVKEGDAVEVVVAHRRRFRYTVVLDTAVPPNEAWVNGEGMDEYGIADNSIATIRRALSAA